MNVIAAINGQITAEVSAFYALHFARVHGFSLILLHVINPRDNIEAVEKSMANIEEVAEKYGMATKRVLLNGPPIRTLEHYLLENSSEILFCSTRYHQRKNLFNLSFSQKLSSMTLPVDLAVVRVVQPRTTLSTKNILLPIRGNRMSVEKFTFLASMAKAYKARCEIYSVTVVGKKKRARLDQGEIKLILKKNDDRLSHYRQLAHHMAIPLRLKHSIALDEMDQVLYHLSHTNFDLVIVGGERLSIYSSMSKATPIERLHRCTSVNTIAFYLRRTAR